jgi:hypothetical protein
MNSRVLALIMAIVFLLTHSGCASLQKGQVQNNNQYNYQKDIPQEEVRVQSEHILDDQYDQWEKEEREWLITVLIVLGVALLIGATVSASSGGNGFFLGIND